jgi:hypothetical protein
MLALMVQSALEGAEFGVHRTAHSSARRSKVLAVRLCNCRTRHPRASVNRRARA